MFLIFVLCQLDSLYFNHVSAVFRSFFRFSRFIVIRN